MKKLFLVLGFFVIGNNTSIFTTPIRLGTNYPLGHGLNIGISHERDISSKVIMGIIATALLSKIVYDASWHNSYATRVESLYSKMLRDIQHYNIDSMEHDKVPLLFDQLTRDEILTLESWLRDSYCCWIKPWNWLPSQKMAYCQVQALAIIALYGPVQYVNGRVVVKDILKNARSLCSAVSTYPLMYYGIELDQHIEFIKAHAHEISNPLLRSMLKNMVLKLSNIKFLLRQEKEYLDEVHMFEMHKLLKDIRNSNNIHY